MTSLGVENVHFSKYQLQGELGQGSFGIVYKAKVLSSQQSASQHVVPEDRNSSPPPSKRQRTCRTPTVAKVFSQNDSTPNLSELFRAIKKVPCNAPESVELALHEFWALLALTYHENVVYFEECYLQAEDKIVPMRGLNHTSSKRIQQQTSQCQAYLNLLEASLKGECLSYTSKSRLPEKHPIIHRKHYPIPSSPKQFRSASVGASAIPKIGTWATEITELSLKDTDIMQPLGEPKTLKDNRNYLNHLHPTSNNYYLWFVMEFCEGGDLNSHLLSQRNLPKIIRAERNAKYVVDLANGVKFLHDHGVIHRDLKPENTLVAYSNFGQTILKIADFGLSKVCAGKDFESTVLQSACGSDFFMSREVYQGNYTAKADIFSLACMIYAICSDLTFFDAGKELFGLYVEEEYVNQRGRGFSSVIEQNKRPSTAQSSPMRIHQSFKKKNVVNGDNKTSLSHPKYIPVGEAQLNDVDFRLDKLPEGEPCIKGNWSKIKKFVLSMLSKNPNERPNAGDVASTIYSVLDIRVTRRRKSKFIKPHLFKVASP